MQSIRDAGLNNKRVLLRVDFNVPMEDKKIIDDNRIEKSLTTIKYLLDRKTKIIIMTHLGKPDGTIVPSLSTVPLAQELAKILKRKVYATDHIIHPSILTKIDEMDYGDILMLGNLRWHSEEESNNDAFARELATYADIYINDAFGVSHRAHASVSAITKYLPSYSGFLLESEVTTLGLLMKNPFRPFVLVLGGAKVKDKASLIKNFAPKVDKILIGGAIANTFLKAKGEDIGESLYEPEMFEKCEEMLGEFGDKIMLPQDSVKQELENGKFNILDMGPNTVSEYVSVLNEARTIFWNGNMGHSEDEKYAKGTFDIATAISKSPGTTVIAGGDTVGFVDSHNLKSGINFISTGGGATLSFLAGEPMPGIEALENTKQMHFSDEEEII